MCIRIMVLTIEEKATAALRIKVPQQYTKTAFCQETGEVDGCSGLTNATFDIIYGDLFQNLKLITKSVLQ